VISTRIQQIYYKPEHTWRLDDLWEHYNNTGSVTPYFENEVIRELYLASDHVNSDYYGVFSYKFNNKHHKSGEYIKLKMQQDDHKHDVYSFFGNAQFAGRSKFNTFQDRTHPNLLELGEKIIKKLFGKDILKIQADRIYYNHWIGSKEVFGGYCKDMLLPAMELMEGELKELVWTDSKYNNQNLRNHITINAPMTPERCTEVFGVPYYPHHAFILERLPSIYFAIKGYTIKHI
tara:strand:- start:226 stop:924 length:699 start_codon:yes stop_codon:yes gene_type:complete